MDEKRYHATQHPVPQSVLDALCDAEQLRLYYACAGFPGVSAWDAFNSNPDLGLRPGGTRYAAREAFRNVPALRELR